MRRSRAAVGAAVLLLAGCDDGVVRAIIGPEGGTLEGYGAKLEIPAGALSETRELTLSAQPDGAPVSKALSPLYQFGPSGLTFVVPVQLDVDIPDGKQGLLYWSKPGDKNAFSVVGLAFGGKAGGLTTHFSDAYVGDGLCDRPTTTKCACRAGDEVADLLCEVDPSTDHACRDINSYSGQSGGSCSGYGPRPDLHTRCYCYDTKIGFLCQDHIGFSPLPHCPTDGGLNGYVDIGEEGASCSGYMNDVKAAEDKELSGSGTLVDCHVESWADVYQSLSGTLEGCYVTRVSDTTNTSAGSEAPGPAGASGGSDSQGGSCAPRNPTFSGDCLALINQREKAGLKTSCKAPSDLTEQDKIRDWFKDLGSAVHKEVQARFLAAHPSTGHVEVWVPNASKAEDCVLGGDELEVEPAEDDDSDSDYEPGDGRVDLLRIVGDGSADPLVVEIAEIKPATRSGLRRASYEVYTCYLPHIELSGPSCRAPNSGVEHAFCGELGAVGRTVAVKEPGGLIWPVTEQQDPITVTIRPGEERSVKIMSCGDGIVGYLCLDEEQGQP